jgi:hypothetical protein
MSIETGMVHLFAPMAEVNRLTHFPRRGVLQRVFNTAIVLKMVFDRAGLSRWSCAGLRPYVKLATQPLFAAALW